MAAAAGRRLDRRKKAFEEARKLVDLGAAPQASLGPLQEEVDWALRECGLAEERAAIVREVTQMARAEELLATRLAEEPSTAHEIAERHDGDGVFTNADFAAVEKAFREPFRKAAAGERHGGDGRSPRLGIRPPGPRGCGASPGRAGRHLAARVS